MWSSTFLISLQFKKTHANHNLYVLMVDDNICILVLYVDDLIITSSSMDLLWWVQAHLMQTFSMTNLGLLHYFLGFEVLQHACGISLCQKKYSMQFLKKYGMKTCATITCPMDPNSKLSKDDDSPKVNATNYWFFFIWSTHALISLML